MGGDNHFWKVTIFGRIHRGKSRLTNDELGKNRLRYHLIFPDERMRLTLSVHLKDLSSYPFS